MSESVQAQTSSPVYSPRVLFIGIDPTDSTGASLANTYFSHIMGKDAASFEAELAQTTINDFNTLSNGRINYQLAEHMRITSFPTYPNGFEFTVENYSQCVWGSPEFNPTVCDQQKQQFPYEEYIQQHQICEKAEALNVDEIWIVSPPYILAWEAFMVGPNYGFGVNGPSYTVPSCNKHIIAVNATYDRPGQMLHSYAHRVEATVDYLMRNFKPADRANYWERFAARNPTTRSSGVPFCGNTHFPFNFAFEYDYGSTSVKFSTCSDFSNFPNYTGTQESYECSRWGCSDSGWQKHWMSFIPHSGGTVAITDNLGKTYQFKKDWWYYLLYPENALKSEVGIFEKTGDGNGDGVVDGKDYVKWLNNYQRTTTAGASEGDYNNDGIVDGKDYVKWLNNYGT